jgi:phage tail protein X
MSAITDYDEYLTHITGPADRWDWLAYLYYGDATMYDTLMAANPGLGPGPFLPVGVQVKVPVVNEDDLPTDSTNAPPWVS